jgi:hypothetical protein
MSFSPETLTYVQTVKNFLKKNESARTYFLTGVDEDTFFEHLSDIAEKNLKSFGDPTLNREQFDLLRKTMKAINVVNLSMDELPEIKPEDWVFVDHRGFGKICLN